MSFTSVFYLLFLGLVTTVNYLLPAKYRSYWLLSAGYFFYLTWQPLFLIVLLCVTLCSFQFGRKIAAVTDKNSKKRWLIFSVLTLLLPLVFFKYHNFLNDNLARILARIYLTNPVPNQPYLVPLGISFFTFQAVSYVADIYRGYLKPERQIGKFALYLAFFPTLLAGPIERAKSMLKQIHNPAKFDPENIRAGLQLILWGVFKKLVIADRISDFMKTAYSQPENMSGVLIYFAVVFSVFQFFCDFSAYSDIAVGSARLFGIKLSKNFDDRVYAAPSREMFWQGWHRTLTAWLRDYVFFPLSRRIKNRARLYLNLLIVYFLVGLWHGATWGFIIWGLLNGVWLVLENATKTWRRKLFAGINTDGRTFNFFAWLLVFHAGAVFGVFFRTETVQEALDFLGNLANPNENLLGSWEIRNCAVTIALLILMDLINRQIPAGENFDVFINNQKMWLRWLIYIVLAELILRYAFAFGDARFLYFQF